MSSINSLPEEVLAAIVAAVAKDVAPAAGESDGDTPGEEEGEKKKKMVATGEEAEPLVAACALGELALVNRRFHRLVLPYLYADLRVNWDKHNGNYGVVEDTSARVIVNGPQVYHLLAHKPALRLLCRRLKFSFAPQQPPSDQSQVEMAADIVSWCADVTSLDISYLSSSGEGAWPRLHEALRGMSRLERLSTFTNQGGFDLAWLMDLVAGLGSLGSLRVGQSNGGNTPPARPVLKAKPAPPLLTELTVGVCGPESAKLGTLLKWPARLEKLSLTYSGFEDSSEFAPIQAALSSHHQTLHTLDLHYISISDDSPEQQTPIMAFLDLRPLTALTHVTLDQETATHYDCSLFDRILAPNLHILVWDLDLSQSWEDGQCCLNRQVVDWLQTLARAVAAVRNNPAADKKNVGLQVVEIKYTPEHEIETLDSDVYPWDLLEGIVGEMKEAGIELRWNEPTVSREEYVDIRNE